MSNVKISQLPVFTGTTAGSWLIANNSAETTTFKIERENFLTGYATTGSNTFVGNQTITGSLILSGSTHTIIGNTFITGTINQDGSSGTNKLSGIQAISGSIIIHGTSPSGQKFLYFNNASGSAGATLSYTPGQSLFGIFPGISGSVTIGTNLAGTNTLFGDTRLTGSAHSITGSLGIRGNVQITGSITQTGSLTVTGSIIQTGSVQGNVVALSISSNTASMNLNDANFFTLQLVSGSATNLNPSNIKPGQTVSVFVNTTGSATMTFPSSIKQISGSAYTPTTTTGIDVLTLISKDTSNLYLVNAKNMI
jgi:hypothetical protein